MTDRIQNGGRGPTPPPGGDDPDGLKPGGGGDPSVKPQGPGDEFVAGSAAPSPSDAPAFRTSDLHGERPSTKLPGSGTNADPYIVPGEWSFPEELDEESIITMVHAIVINDRINHPGRNPVITALGAHKNRGIFYRLGDRIVSFRGLISSLRVARGLSARDHKSFSDIEATSVIRKEIFVRTGFDPDKTKPLGSTENPVQIFRTDGSEYYIPAELTEEDVEEVLFAMIEGDPDIPLETATLYVSPGFSAWGKRQYRFGDVLINRGNLYSRLRALRGRGNEPAISECTKEWREKILERYPIATDGMSNRGEKMAPIILRHPEGEEWLIPEPMTTEFIDLVVGTIPEQEGSLFRKGLEGLTYQNPLFRRTHFILDGVDPMPFNMALIARWEAEVTGSDLSLTRDAIAGIALKNWTHRKSGSGNLDLRKPDGSMLKLPLLSQMTLEDIDAAVDGILSSDPKFPSKNPFLALGPHNNNGNYTPYKAGAVIFRIDDLVAREKELSTPSDIPNAEVYARWRRRQIAMRPLAFDAEAKLGSVDNPIILSRPGGRPYRIPKRMNIEFVNMILKAVASLDPKYADKRNIADITVSTTRYFFLDHQPITLSRIATWERQARGFASEDSKNLPPKEIARRWKRYLMQIFPYDGDASSPLGSKDNPMIPKRPDGRLFSLNPDSDGSAIYSIVAAIVDQYPEMRSDIGFPDIPLTRKESPKSKKDVAAHVLLDGELITMHGLVDHERAIKLKSGEDKKNLTNQHIVNGWRREYLKKHSIEPDTSMPIASKNNPVILSRADGTPFDLLERPSIDEINEILDSIQRVDPLYSKQNGFLELAATKEKCAYRYYFTGSEIITLNTLMGWERTASGHLGTDSAAMPPAAVIRRWKLRFFKNAPFVADATLPSGSQRNPIQIFDDDGDSLLVPDPMDETFFWELLERISRTDPDYSGRFGLISFRQPKQARYYLAGADSVSHGNLQTMYAELPGVNIDRSETLAIYKKWQRHLLKKFPFEPDTNAPLGTQQNPVTIGNIDDPAFHTPQKMTTEYIDRVIREIVANDPEYAGQYGAKLLGKNIDRKGRYYLLDGELVSLRMIAGWERLARGIVQSDGKSMSDLTIFNEWKKRIFGIGHDAMTTDEFRTWVDENDFSEVVGLFENAPDSLMDFLGALSAETTEYQLVRLMRAFAELKFEGGWKPTSAEPEQHLEIRDPLIRALMMRRELIQLLGEDKIAAIIEASKRHWQSAFNKDPHQTIAAIKSLVDQIADARIKHILSAIASSFEASIDFTVPTIKTELLPFQREGASFLSQRDAAILADEPGLGKTIQAIAAAEYIKTEDPNTKQKVLIIAPASVKQTWASQLSTDPKDGHLKDDRKVIAIEGNRTRRRQLALSSADADYVIINYEGLIDIPLDELAAMTKGVTIKIVDEAQMIQNPSDEVKRAAATRRIDAQKTWYLTATPYFAHVEHIWTHLNDLEPGKHGTLAEFRTAHADDEVGLITLNKRLEPLMLRRLKKDVVGTYNATLPLEEQPLLLPELKWIDTDETGKYMMSEEQQAASLLLLSDFDTFWDEYGDGERLPHEILHLERMEMLFRILHEPDRMDLNGVEAKYETLDKIIAERIGKGQKIVIYTGRKREVGLLVERYAQHNVVTYTGDLSESAREKSRRRFQDGDAQIMIGTDAMQFGIDLTAADALIFSQYPWTFTELYQIADRIQRMDPHHKKYSADIIQLVATYPGMSDPTPDESAYLKVGSYDELLTRHIERAKHVFRMVMDMPFGQKHMTEILRRGVSDKLFDKAKGYRRKVIKTGEIFYPLYMAAKSFDEELQERAQSAIVGLTELLAGEDAVAKTIAADYLKMLERADGENAGMVELPVGEIEMLAGLRMLRNKHLRANIVRHLPEILKNIHSEGKLLDELFLASEATTPLQLLSWMLIYGSDHAISEDMTISDLLYNRVEDLDAIDDDDERRMLEARIEETFLVLFDTKKSARDTLAKFLQRHSHILADNGLDRFTAFIEMMASTKVTSPTLFEMLLDSQFNSFEEFVDIVRDFEIEPYFDELGVKRSAGNAVALKALTLKGVDAFVLLSRGLKESGYTAERSVLKNAFQSIVAGKFDSWRGENAAGGIEFLDDDVNFWTNFNRRDVSVIKLPSDKVDVAAEIKDGYEELVDVIKMKAASALPRPSVELEHMFIWKQLEHFLSLKKRGMAAYVSKVRKAIKAVDRLKIRGAATVTTAERALLSGMGIEGCINDESMRDRVCDALSRLARWSEGMLSAYEYVAEGNKKALPRALSTLLHLSHGYRKKLKGEKDHVAKSLIQFVTLIKNIKLKLKSDEIEVEDTGDWESLSNTGRLHPDMINCLIPTGNIEQTRTLVDFLASRNKRMITVRDKVSGEILSASFLMLRQDEDGNPIFHIERSFGRKGSKFEDQMIEHVRSKRSSIGKTKSPIKITRQARTAKERDRGIKIMATGSASGHEYVEDLFGVRQSDSVGYKAHLIDDGTAIPGNSGGGGGSGGAHGPMMRSMPIDHSHVALSSGILMSAPTLIMPTSIGSRATFMPRMGGMFM